MCFFPLFLDLLAGQLDLGQFSPNLRQLLTFGLRLVADLSELPLELFQTGFQGLLLLERLGFTGFHGVQCGSASLQLLGEGG